MEERIKYLFRQYLTNACTREEFEEFFSYINEASHNELIRELIKQAYDETGQAQESFPYVDEQGKLVLTEPAGWHARPVTQSKSVNKKRVFLITGICVVVLVTSIILMLYKPHAKHAISAVPGLTKKITQRSEYKYLLLPDSTQVWLNAASELEYPQHFGAGAREVVLSGEAYFDVKHAEHQPFIIRTGKVTTKVLGTAFNIKAYPGRENIIVAVSRGKVQVNYLQKEVATLTQGQQVKVSHAAKPAVEKKAIITEAAAWQHGNLVYDDELICDIISDLERIYDVTIQVQHEAIARERISTSFKREIGLESALQVLCNLTDTRLTRQNNMYLIQ